MYAYARWVQLDISSKNLFSFLELDFYACKMIFYFIHDAFRYFCKRRWCNALQWRDPKMEVKHGDYRNLTSSHGCKYFIEKIPQGFFQEWHSLLYLLHCCVGLGETERLTFSKLKFECDPFSRVSTICATWVSFKSHCWPDSNSFFTNIVLVS